MVRDRNLLTQERLKELVDYNPETGKFTWIKKHPMARKIEVGDEFRSVDSYGYLMASILGNRCKAHRLAFLYMTGEWPSDQVDHINGIRKDNRWCNLREVNNLNNHRNMKLQKRNISGVTGVFWHKKNKKWRAMIRANGRNLHLGVFDNLSDAKRARIKAERKYGYHPNHGRRQDATM